jgi:hypothetical protein
VYFPCSFSFHVFGMVKGPFYPSYFFYHIDSFSSDQAGLAAGPFFFEHIDLCSRDQAGRQAGWLLAALGAGGRPPPLGRLAGWLLAAAAWAGKLAGSPPAPDGKKIVHNIIFMHKNNSGH